MYEIEQTFCFTQKKKPVGLGYYGNSIVYFLVFEKSNEGSSFIYIYLCVCARALVCYLGFN